ncbi:DUF4025 domain-containing protein [Bacillus infantis]|uniref:DUF4025 domain-containing protein n=1 Tax=Bacillus infantis TaxID=324767 RepID=A0A5D4RL25_9BACI|nr:DUF4025 domain-containing protein [Bacillus infantis]
MKNNKQNQPDTTQIAARYFNASDYEGNSQLEQGLAETHEQVGDDYNEGTVDQLKK